MENEQTSFQLVTIEEMRELAKIEPYRVLKEEFPLELLKDNETNMLYTDFFAQLQEDTLRSHILVELLFQAFDDVDWAHVTYDFDPHILARICGLYRYPLQWIAIPEDWKGKYIVSGKICAECYDEEREDDKINFLATYLAPARRALSFARELPYVQVGESSSFMLKHPIHDWRIILADLSALDNRAPDPKDPYFMNEVYPIYERKIFIENLMLVRKNFGTKKALEIIQLLRDEWKYISTLHLFGYEDGDEDAKDLEHFIFKELDLYTSSWNIETEERSEEQDTKEPQDFTSCIFTKKAKKEDKQKEIIDSLKASMVGAPDKARALVKEIRSWQKDDYLDSCYRAKVFFDELSKFLALPFSYDGFRKYFYE